jgi:hypothetical protein
VGRRKEPNPPPAWPAARPLFTDPLDVADRYGNPATLCDHWKGCAAFLVCGGPSLKSLPYHRLAERGICSLGINNVAGLVPVKAFTCCDPAMKFHHGIWLDGGVIKLVPKRRLGTSIRVKQDGVFQTSSVLVRDCPAVYGYRHGGCFDHQTFLTSWEASWGVSLGWHEKTGRARILFTFFLGLRLLHYLGVRRIYLLGADFHMTPENSYAFGTARHDGAAASNNNSYRQANLYCQDLKPVLAQAGVEVYNCNPDSGLRAWEHVPFAEALEDCRGAVPSGDFDLDHWYDKQIPDGVNAAEWYANWRSEQQAAQQAKQPA